jgi:hypothetical protein
MGKKTQSILSLSDTHTHTHTNPFMMFHALMPSTVILSSSKTRA